jgi:hypothetical protein
MAFYEQSRPRINTETGKRVIGFSAYDHADRISDAAEAYKRCRKVKTFILTDESPDLKRFACSVCGKQMNDHTDTPEGYRGNFVDYSPRSKTFYIKHYMCAWNTLLGAICTSYTLADAAKKYQRAQGRVQRVTR